MNDSAIVIGGGVTGLAVSWALRRAGRSVRLLEKTDRVGGAIRSIQRDGYLAEAGPNTLLVNSPVLENCLRGFGLFAHMLRPADTAKNRFILKNGEWVAAPLGPGELLSTPLISTSAKFQLLAELWAKKPEGLREESLASFVTRHFGTEILDYVVNPFVGGIYAGDPRKLSAQHAFPMLTEAEDESGSVIRGMIKERRSKRARGELFKPYSVTFTNGMQTLTDAISSKLGDALRLNANVTAIEQLEHRWQVSWQDADGLEHTETADELYLTTPASGLAKLPLPDRVSDALKPLAEIEYPPVAVVAIGYDKRNIGHDLDGFGGLIPEAEKRDALGILFTSSLFTGRAPEGKALLTVFIGGMRQPELARKPHDELKTIAMREVNQLLGATGEPEFVEINTWPRAIPQYNVGYGDFIAKMESAEAAFPGLHLLGNYRGGISVGQCLVNGAEAVEPLG